MDSIFDLSNIAGGIILTLGLFAKKGSDFTKFAKWLAGFKVVFGIISLILGFIYLLKPGCILFDITGILVGLLLLADSAGQVPGLGKYLEKGGNALKGISTIIGILAIVFGIMGLLDIHFLC